jgi:hypothetical protein
MYVRAGRSWIVDFVAVLLRRRLFLAALLTISAVFFYCSSPVRPPRRVARLLPRPGPSPAVANLTVNLVIASVAADDTSWTKLLHAHVPGLRVIRYVSDSTTAEFRPPVPRKGREATIYHTYLYDFYDSLPDISIFIHAHEDPWHADGVLQQSMLFTLSRLDLEQVVRRGYANLRVSWRDACPDWINTTKTPLESVKQEEPFMRRAWHANFDIVKEPVPEILAGPCCSQMAVTRDAIRRRPRAQYARSRDWLLQSDWSDYIVGRTWEHMFPWLFAAQARDCPVEWRAYCRMYGVCFERPEAPARYNELWRERRQLSEKTEFLQELVNPQAGVAARKRIDEISQDLDREIQIAIQRGRDRRVRADAGSDLEKP